MSEDTNKPQLIEDAALDDTSAGIGLLLPAVQKVRSPAARPSANASPTQPDIAVPGDGSV